MNANETIDFQQIDIDHLDASAALTALVQQAVALRSSDLFFLSNESSVASRTSFNHSAGTP